MRWIVVANAPLDHAQNRTSQQTNRIYEPHRLWIWDVPMTLDRELLLSELRSLRKGRGLRHTMLPKRLGPQSKQLFGVSSVDSPGIIRSKISARIRQLLGEGPDHTQLIAVAVFGLHPEADHRLLEGRVRWLAQRLRCTERTVRRRIDDALDLLVESAIAGDNSTQDDLQRSQNGWRVQAFWALYRLDRPNPEAIERRTIVFLEDGLREIVYPLSIFRVPGDTSPKLEVDIDVLFGLRLQRREQPIPEHFRFYLALPDITKVGQILEYGLRLSIPTGQPARPQYIYTPVQDCDLFDLIVRFDPNRLPAAVWRLDGALPLLVDHDGIQGESLTPDNVGEVRARFRALQRGLGYGLKWSH